MLRVEHATTSHRISAIFLLGLIFLVLALRERLTDWPLLLARYLGLLAL